MAPECRLSPDRRSLSSNTYPRSTFQYPGVHKATAPNDGLAVLKFIRLVGSRDNRRASKNLHKHGLSDDLLHVLRFHMGEKIRFVHQRSISVDIDQGIVEERIERFQILKCFRLIPGVFEREYPRPRAPVLRVLRLQRADSNTSNREQANEFQSNPHGLSIGSGLFLL